MYNYVIYYICILHLLYFSKYICITGMYILHIYTYVYIRINIDVSRCISNVYTSVSGINICKYILNIHIYISAYVYTCIYVQINTHVRMRVCAYICICTYIYTRYIYIHIPYI